VDSPPLSSDLLWWNERRENAARILSDL